MNGMNYDFVDCFVFSKDNYDRYCQVRRIKSKQSTVCKISFVLSFLFIILIFSYFLFYDELERLCFNYNSKGLFFLFVIVFIVSILSFFVFLISYRKRKDVGMTESLLINEVVVVDKDNNIYTMSLDVSGLENEKKAFEVRTLLEHIRNDKISKSGKLQELEYFFHNKNKIIGLNIRKIYNVYVIKEYDDCYSLLCDFLKLGNKYISLKDININIYKSFERLDELYAYLLKKSHSLKYELTKEERSLPSSNSSKKYVVKACMSLFGSLFSFYYFININFYMALIMALTLLVIAISLDHNYLKTDDIKFYNIFKWICLIFLIFYVIYGAYILN